MILPIGHQEISVRRLPWVTFALMASCIVAFLFTDTSAIEEHGSGAAGRLEEAANYWRMHAYLEPDPRIRDHVAYDVMPNQRRQYLATLPVLAEPMRPSDPEARAAEQAELDRLVALAFGEMQAEGEEHNPFQRWGFTPDAPRASTLFTHMFMHGGWFHLIGNLFILLLAGPPIEDRWGRALFAGFYVLAGAFSALFHGMVDDATGLPLVGASGAVSAVLGAFLVRLWNTKIRFAYFFMIMLRIYTGTFEAPAWAMLPLWFGNELFQALFWDSLGVPTGVAYWAHVGGFLAGVGVALGVRALKYEERFIDPVVEAKMTRFSANPVLEEAMTAREGGEVGQALELLEAEWQRESDEDVAVALWDAALACEQPERGAAALQSAIRSAAKRGDLEVALRHWSELSDHIPTVPVDPGNLLRFVPLLLQESQRERAVLALRRAVSPDNAPLTPGLAMRAVDLAREVDPPSALRAARTALASGELHEAKQAKLEGFIAELEASGVEEPGPEPQKPVSEEPKAVWDEAGAIGISRFARAKLTEALPSGLDADAIRLRLQGDREGAVSFDRIQAVSAAIVADQGPKPILVIDLLANWNEPEAEALRGVRLRSDRFDPRRLLGSEGDPRQAFGALVGRLIEASRAVPLPSAEAALGQPFARYATLAEYQREVLGVAE
jgi:membrane associated rhomboid family serine protease